MAPQVSLFQSQETIWYTPIHVNARRSSGHEIQTLTANHPLCEKVVAFLKNKDLFHLYGEERSYTDSEARGLVSEWRSRSERGNPLSGFAISKGGEVVGVIWTLLDTKLRVTGLEIKREQNQDVLFGALNWLVRTYLPHHRFVRLEDNQWLDLKEMNVEITNRSGGASHRLFEGIGFQKQISTGPPFLWRRPRNISEVANLLHVLCLAVIAKIQAHIPWKKGPLEVYEAPLSQYIS